MEKKKRKRKKIIYTDLSRIEQGSRLTRSDRQIKEKLGSTRDFDSLIFWMDLQEGLKNLTEHQKECFLLHFVEGFSQEEISSKKGISQSAVSQNLYLGRKKMQLFLWAYL